MSILESPDLIALTEVPRLLTSGGKPPSHACVWRWAVKGIGGVRLKAFRIGRKWYTTPGHIKEFGETLAANTISRLNAQPDSDDATIKPPTRSEYRREADISRATERLRENGISA